MVIDIQNVRMSKGMSRAKLAQVLAKSKWTIQAWELGRRNPRSLELGEIAQALGVEIRELFRPDPKKKESDPTC